VLPQCRGSVDSCWRITLSMRQICFCIGALPIPCIRGRSLLRRASPPQAFVFGLGLAILANTRPYEGFVLGVSAAVFLLVHWVRQVLQGRKTSSHLIRSIDCRFAAILVPAFRWM
jgi:hypothetical protein